MRRILLMGVLLLLIGCQGVTGPRERRAHPERVDDPRLSIPEQQERGRDRLAIPEPSKVAPPTYDDPPSVKGDLLHR
jgi:hypothetical protein